MTALDPAVRSALNTIVTRLITPPPHQRIAAVIDLVAWHTGVNRGDIIGKSRVPAMFQPRAAVCWLAVELKLGSATTIGRAIGHRNHSTIIDAHRRGEDFRLRDPAFKRLTDRLLQHFRDLQED